ncbi:MAG TPA: methyltransferase domain-containing protein [Blastocatellia bacterium]|nr:methyltransferase domain-containing protein [Blastocatellia bacterium]
MLLSLLDILSCPFCGSRFSLESGWSLEQHGDEILNGILFCECAAYPVVAGIPVLTSDYLADNAREQLARGEREQALFTMLGLDTEDQQLLFRRFLEQGEAASYREAIGILCPDAEGTYFVYRFSDPTFMVGQTLLRAIGSDPRCRAGRMIDLCGGSGHLTRVLCQIANGAEVVLADVYFWKLWLARRYTAPACRPVCCDANNPLPFKRGSFSLAVCSDAFHYIWSKRLLASEIMRMVGEAGVILLSHVHNSLVDNFSAGMPLAPRWWRNLFAELNPRVYRESDVFESAVARRPVDLSPDYSDEELREEAALFLIATRLEGLFRIYPPAVVSTISGVLGVNPLYRVEPQEAPGRLRLRFPSPDYEQEFGACKRYLEETVEIGAGLFDGLSTAPLTGERKRLIEERVLLDLPRGYL